MRTKLFIACLVMMNSIFLFSCNHSDKSNSDIPENALNPDAMSNPATASENNGESESLLPVFQFAEEEFDFGSITEGESVSHAFKFKNTGKSDLLISSASGSCGCTVPEWPKDPIPPGKEGVVNVRFNSEGKSGMQHKTITLVANTIPNSKVLTISGEVVKK